MNLKTKYHRHIKTLQRNGKFLMKINNANAGITIFVNWTFKSFSIGSYLFLFFNSVYYNIPLFHNGLF